MKAAAMKGVFVAVAAISMLGLLAAPASAGSNPCAGIICLFVNGTIDPGVQAGATVSFDNVFTGGVNEVNVIHWMGVGTPNGDLYVMIPPDGQIIFDGGASGGVVDCSVQYGGAGPLSITASSSIGTAFTLGCEKTPVWIHDTSDTASTLASDCTSGITPNPSGTATNGDTSQTGTYLVVSCYAIPITLQFQVPAVAFQIFHAPQFGSLGIAVGIAFVALIFVRKRATPVATRPT